MSRIGSTERTRGISSKLLGGGGEDVNHSSVLPFHGSGPATFPRFHPSFRFEEALAARLSDVASRIGSPATTGGPERWIFPLPLGDPDEPAPFFGRRPLIIGGALTSAALSLAGAAYVAWRRNRPPASPMVRAARAVARTRPV